MNLADGFFPGRASVGAIGISAARTESGPTEQLAGSFLFQNTGPDDGCLGRDAPTLGRDAPYATYKQLCL